MEINPKNVFLRYFRKNAEDRTSRDVVVCGIVDTENNKIHFHGAVCSKKQQFERKFGRKIAFERAAKKPYLSLDVNAADRKAVASLFVSKASEIQAELPNFFDIKAKEKQHARIIS